METSPPPQLPGSPVFGWARSAGNGKLLAALRTVPPQHAAATLLAAVLAFQAAVTLSSIVLVLKHRPGENAGAIHVEPAIPHSFASLAAAHLFGAPPPPQAETKGPQPVSSAPLVLAGTIALADVTQGLAIIGSDVHSARTHRVGETVADGITLKEVYTDHAVIDRGGQIETVWLPHSSLLQALTPKAYASASPTSAAPAQEMPPMPSDIRDRFAYENQRVGTALTETPLMAGEVFRGLLVQAGPDPAILQQMGLKPGDEVIGVDGITITDAEHIDLLRRALLSGRKFRMDVVRHNGGQESLELDAGAFQGLITN